MKMHVPVQNIGGFERSIDVALIPCRYSDVFPNARPGGFFGLQRRPGVGIIGRGGGDLGSAAFLSTAEGLTSRRLRPRPAGRPSKKRKLVLCPQWR